MKVLVCIPCLMTGGTEIQTLNLVKALISAKYEVVTVCYFEHSEQMVDAYRNTGCDVVCLSELGKRVEGLEKIMFLYQGLRRTIKEINPDVAHVQYMDPGAIPILILKLLGVKRIVATSHTFADIYSDLRLVHFIQRHCVRAFTCITCLAEKSFFGSSTLFSDDLPLKKRNHFTIYNALSPYIQVISHGRKYVGTEKTIMIGIVSRLEKIKGIDLVVPAFAKIHKSFPDTRLLVVGDGSLREQMKEQAAKMRLTDVCKFTGRMGQDQLASCYDEIDILLMPSRSEGFGLTAIEGMARGCVVVASHIGGLPEVVCDGDNGLLHQSEDIEDLTKKVSELIVSPKLMETLSQNAVQTVGKFSFDRYAKAFNSLYDKIK